MVRMNIRQRFQVYGRKRHRWVRFVFFILLGAISFFLIGLGRREMWMALLLVTYLVWITRRD